MNDITIPTGIRGTRLLARMFAIVTLRKRGLIKNGKPTLHLHKYAAPDLHRMWQPDELKLAKDMRLQGATYAHIGKLIGRGRASVHYKIGRRAA